MSQHCRVDAASLGRRLGTDRASMGLIAILVEGGVEVELGRRLSGRG
jgi:hypothetical protein